MALREIGQIERTLFTLDWLQNVELRRRVHAGFNKGEAKNALARAVFFNRLSEAAIADLMLLDGVPPIRRTIARFVQTIVHLEMTPDRSQRYVSEVVRVLGCARCNSDST